MNICRPSAHVVAATLLALAAEYAGPVLAEEKNTAQVEEIVVVAHKQARSANDVAANVTVVSGDDVRLALGASIADALRYTPGVDFESAGSRFGDESINIRGISGNRVAVLVDGVPVSDRFEVGNFSNATRDLVDAGFIEHIEVLHGPASALYGSSAIGGVVAMSTVDPGQLAGPGGSGGRLVTGWRGDNSGLSGSAVQALEHDSVGLLGGISAVNASEFDSAAADDNLDRRDMQSRSGMLKLVVDDAAGNTWKAFFHRRESDVSSSLESMLGTGRFRTTTALLGDDTSRSDMTGLEYHFNTDLRLLDEGVVLAWYQDSDILQNTVDERAAASRPVTIDRQFSFNQRSRGLEVNLQKELFAGGVRHQLGYGMEYRKRDTDEYRDGLETGLVDGVQTNVLLGEVFPLRDFPLSTTEEWGAYLEDTISIGSWSLIAALRADSFDMQPTVDAMYAEDYPFAEPVAISESELSPKLGLIYRLGTSAEVYVQYSHGFRAPPYEDANISLELPLFNMRAIPNPDLRSERSEGIDVGLRWRGDGRRARLSVFRTEYDDFIESKMLVGTDPVSGRILYQSRNLDRAVIEGVEAGLGMALDGVVQGLSLETSLFMARSENLENGQALNSVGPPQAVVGIDWVPANGAFQASLLTTATGDWGQRDETAGELFKPAGYAVTDLYLLWHLGERVTLRAAAMNLTDRTYWAWTDVGGLAPDDPVIPYLSRPGRSFGVGVDVRW